MKENEYKKRFEKLYNRITEAIVVFNVWKGLQNKEFEPTFKKNNNFWLAVLRSLEDNYLTLLAKIFEKSKYSEQNKIISVYSVIKYQSDTERAAKARLILDKNQKVIKNIQILRHNKLAHDNASFAFNPSIVLEKFPIKYGEIEDLLKISNELLSALNPDSGHGYLFDTLTEDSQNDSRDIIKKLKYYSKRQKIHFDNLKKGMVSNPRFPEGEAENVKYND